MSTKITRRPLNKGAPRFPSMQSQTQTEEGYIRRFYKREPRGDYWTKSGVYSIAVFHLTLSFTPAPRVLLETLKVAPFAMVI